MAENDKAFAGSIPELYDRYLVPLLFQDCAEDIAGRIAKSNPAHVLEIAAGTGVVTRALAPRLATTARLVVTDLNQPMLDRAKVRQSADPRCEWQQADALALPFPDQTFDAVLCQFGVMFFPDKPAGYREAQRVLKPGGRFAFNVWDRLEANGFPAVINDALAELFPADPPRFLPRTPYGYNDADRIRAEMKDAGFVDVSVTVVDTSSKAPSARDPAIGFCQGTPLRGEVDARDPSGLEKATAHAAAAIARKFGNGPVAAPIRALVFEGRRA